MQMVYVGDFRNGYAEKDEDCKLFNVNSIPSYGIDPSERCFDLNSHNGSYFAFFAQGLILDTSKIELM